MNRSAPLGIKIAGTLHILILLFGVYVGAAAASRYDSMGFLVFLLGAVQLLVGVIIVYGIWTLKPWGYRIGLVYLGLILILNLIAPFITNTPPSAAGIAVLWILVFAGYLLTKREFYPTTSAINSD